jgi:hypothetical protein
MIFTNLLCLLPLLTSITAFPFMADFHSMTAEQKREYTDMYKRMAARSVPDGE